MVIFPRFPPYSTPRDENYWFILPSEHAMLVTSYNSISTDMATNSLVNTVSPYRLNEFCFQWQQNETKPQYECVRDNWNRNAIIKGTR